MRPDLLSDAELVRQTSQLVAARCRSQPMDAAELPSLIKSVATALRPQHAPASPSRNVVYLSEFIKQRKGAAKP